MEMRGIDPRAPRMQSECSTIWATPPDIKKEKKKNKKGKGKAQGNVDASSLDNTWYTLSAPSWKALKKSAYGRQPMFLPTVLCFYFVSWKLFTTVATSPYLSFVFCCAKLSRW